ncbi:MAG: hypothetical protein ACYSWO_23530 [Planctomycetota bacterium]
MALNLFPTSTYNEPICRRLKKTKPIRPALSAVEGTNFAVHSGCQGVLCGSEVAGKSGS